MTEHDPLCRWHNLPITDSGATIDYPFPCTCDLIAKVRAEEQVKKYSFAVKMVLERSDYLRGKVTALPGSRWVGTGWVRRDAVLDLLDGGST